MFMINQTSISWERFFGNFPGSDSHCLGSWAYKAENDSVYMKNYHQKWSTLLGQPVSYYDVIFSHLFISFIPLFFSFPSSFTKKALEMIIQSGWVFFFRGPFQPRSPSYKRNCGAQVMILIFFYFISPYILHLLYDFYCSNMWLWAACESIKLFFSFPHFAFYRLREILSARASSEEDKRKKNVGEDKILHIYSCKST